MRNNAFDMLPLISFQTQEETMDSPWIYTSEGTKVIRGNNQSKSKQEETSKKTSEETSKEETRNQQDNQKISK